MSTKPKSLTDIAKAIMESNDGAPDRDAKLTNDNRNTLAPKSKGGDPAPIVNPNSNPPNTSEVEDLGPPLVNNTDVSPSAKAVKSSKKDTSGSSQSRKGAVAPEKTQSLAEEEEMELSEELKEFINKMLEEGHDEDAIMEAIDQNFELTLGEESEESEDEEVVSEETDQEAEKVAINVDMSEDVEALLSGETLSEEFKDKAKTIFESAVNTRVESEVARIQEAFEETLTEEIENITETLSESVNDYLNYVVEQWMKENEIAIVSGLRSELTEEFISGLRNLFAENYIDIPEDKVNVIEEMAAQVQDLEERLNEEIDRNVELVKSINESKKEIAINNILEGLSDVQTAKMRQLAENVEYEDSKTFERKLKTLRESYFTAVPVKNDQAIDNDTTDETQPLNESVAPGMDIYVKALGKVAPRK